MIDVDAIGQLAPEYQAYYKNGGLHVGRIQQCVVARNRNGVARRFFFDSPAELFDELDKFMNEPEIESRTRSFKV